MRGATYSEYYGTAFQAWLWKGLNEQNQAIFWQQEPWNNLKEESTFANQIPAEPLDMQANPYRRYCRDHRLPLGTQIPAVRRLKYTSSVVFTVAIQVLKYLVGAVEAAMRIPLSAGLWSIRALSKPFLPNRCTLLMNAACQRLSSPVENAKMGLGSLCQTLIYLVASPGIISNQTKDNRNNISGLYKDFSKQLSYMDGSDIPLWQIYREASRA